MSGRGMGGLSDLYEIPTETNHRKAYNEAKMRTQQKQRVKTPEGQRTPLEYGCNKSY